MKSLLHHILSVKPARRPEDGQGMVEFALILPLLLVLLFGIVELGRLLVIYSSVSAASREAARYGAAAGISPNGVEYYLDEPGMRDQAQRVALLTAVTMDAPTYDSGPGTALKTVNEADDVDLGDRINIVVHANYEPILGLVPGLRPVAINSATSRTILKEVSIEPFGNGGNENENENESNTPPTVVIEQPVRSPIPVFSQDATISFLASVTDPDESGLEGSIVWTSSIDGQLGTGASISASGLSAGTHEITASVTDSAGASGSDHITIQIDPRPEVYILTPSNAEIEEGMTLSFTADVVDNENGLEAQVVWTDDGNEFGTGSPVSYGPTGVRLHTIRACVTDSAGGTGCATLLLPVAAPTPPTLRITSPATNTSYAYGANVVFTGQANDSRDGDLSSQIRWSSSLDGSLGQGSSLATRNLRAGTHTITATVTDSTNLTATATITIQIVDSDAPLVTIYTPTAAQHFNQGVAISFTGVASDAVDGSLTNSLRWTSSRDGAIGTGGSFSYSRLSVGVHTIRAEVTDSNGLVGYAVVVIYIDEHNTPPIVTIINPPEVPSPYVVLRGHPLNFRGTADDAQDGNLSSSIVWSSDRDGQLRVGATFTTTALTVGLHTITASVTDRGTTPLTGSDTVQVRVNDFNCPVPGTATFVQVANNQYGGFNWNITLPSNSSLTTQYTMKTLTLTMESNPASVTIIQDGLFVAGSGPISFFASGNTVRAPQQVGGTVWTGVFGSSGINVTYMFNGRFNRNQGSGSRFRVSAEFVGCPTPIQAIGTLN